METPNQNEKANTPATGTVIDLPSGAKAEKLPFKGKHIREATRICNGDQSKFLFALISVSVRFEGVQKTIEDLDEMDGADVMFLMAEFEGAF